MVIVMQVGVMYCDVMFSVEHSSRYSTRKIVFAILAEGYFSLCRLLDRLEVAVLLKHPGIEHIHQILADEFPQID